MKSKLGIGAAAFLFLITSASAQTNYMPTGSYAPAPVPSSAAQTQEAMEKYAAWMRANMRPAPAAPVAPTYMVPTYAVPAAPTPYGIPVSAPVQAPASNIASSENLAAKEITADKIEVKGELKAGVGHFGKDSVYIGSDTIGNYIKATGTATKNFLRIMIGTTTSNAVEVFRILANGNVRMIGNLGILVNDPQSSIHIANSDALPASLRFTSQGSGVTANDGAVMEFDKTRLTREWNFKNNEGGPVRFLINDGPIGSLPEFLTMLSVTKEGVGIGTGTLNPASILHVRTGTDFANIRAQSARSLADFNAGPAGFALMAQTTATAGDVPAEMVFTAVDPNGTAKDRLKISSAGNIGIGNMGLNGFNPLSQLHIQENPMVPAANGLRITGSQTEATMGTRGEKLVISAKQSAGSPAIGGMNFETIAQDGTYLQPLTISNDGRVYVSNQFCLPNGANIQKDVCFKYACPAANGQWTLSQTACAAPIEPGAVSANINSSFSSPTYVAGANSVRLASFVIAETTGNEDLQITSLRFDKDMNSNFDIQNLRAKVGSQQIGSTRAIVADGEVNIEFIGDAPLPVVPKNGSIIVDLYGDILSSTTVGTYISTFDLIGGMARGASSGRMMELPSPISGQSVVIGAGATLTLTTSANSPSSRYLVMGSTDNTLYSLNLAASGAEDVRVTDIILRDVIANNATGIASFNNLRLYDDTGALLVGPVNMTTTGSTGGDIVFSLGSASSLIIPKNSSKTVTLKGDVATFVSGGAKSGSSHVFGISSPFNVTAYGKDSSVVASVTGTPSGAAQTVYRTKPMLTSSVIGATMGRTRVAVDEIASMVWNANAADDLTINRVSIKLVGQAVTSGTTPFYVSLIDANTNTVWGNSVSQTCTPVAGSQCSVTFNPQFSITRGTNKTVKLRVNSSGFFNNANSSDSLSVVIGASSDILWSDGTTNNIGFEPAQIPITLTNVSYQ